MYSHKLTLAIRLCSCCGEYYDTRSLRLFDRGLDNAEWPKFLELCNEGKLIPVREFVLLNLGVPRRAARTSTIPQTYYTKPTNIFGIAFWIKTTESVAKSMRYKSSAHRVFVECPECGRSIPVGRLHQHAKIHKVEPVSRA